MNRPSLIVLALAPLLWNDVAAARPGSAAQDLLADQSFWQGDPGFFHFEDGVLVGESTAANPCGRTTYFQRTGVEVADFELTVRYRLTGGNSGVQFRSRVVTAPAGAAPGHVEVVGYQADLEDGPNWTGCLYEQGGRGVMARRGQRVAYAREGLRLADDVADGAELLAQLVAGADAEGWSTYRITAAGPALRLEVNGVVTTELFDLHATAARASGALALQLHQGPPMRIEVAGMDLRVLSDEETAAFVTEIEANSPAPPQTDERPHWLWAPGETSDHRIVWFERRFELGFRATSATLSCSADNLLEVELDGTVIAVSNDWSTPVRREAAADDPLLGLLSPGAHVVRVRAENEGGPAGMWFDLDVGGEGADRLRLLSDDSWRVFDAEPSADTEGASPRDLGPLGVDPWGLPQSWSDGRAPAALDPAAIEVADGFRVELVYSVPRHRQGSWVSLTFDPRGRMLASDQYGDLWRLTPGADGAPARVEPVAIELGEAHGLAFVGEDLYAMVAGAGTYASGLHRARDTDGDGDLDTVEALRLFPGSGEHGPHAVVPTRDGTGLWILAGNHTDLPEFVDASRVPRIWDEDQLLPVIEDPNGHANGKRAPGGWLARCDLEGDNWVLWSIGMRNSYDVAESVGGDAFTFDSDMEWDIGLPWYRPTRVLHLVPGSDFGWRTGSGKWPAWVPDSLPAVVDVGKSSPTGVVMGDATAFPGRWKEALFISDWAYGTIHAVHMHAQGSGFEGEAQVFVQGAPLPVTDVAVSPDGALWFTVGGRRTQAGVYRVVVADAARAEAAVPPAPKTTSTDLRARALRKRLEGSGREGERVMPTAGERLEALVSEDRYLRHAARTLETSGAADWGAYASLGIERSTEESMRDWIESAAGRTQLDLDAWLVLERLLSIVRAGPPELSEQVHALLDQFAGVEHDREQTLAALRIRELALVRMPLPLAPELRGLQANLAARFPAGDHDLDRQLGRLLVFLAGPAVAAQGVDGDGGVVARIVTLLEEAQTQEDAIYWMYLVRNASAGWTPELRARVWTAFEARQEGWKGGHSVRRYVDRIVEELELVAPRPNGPWLSRDAEAETIEASVATEGAPFVRAWDYEELLPRVTALAADAWAARDLEQGAAAYVKASCNTCHRFGDIGMLEGGGGVGQDLTGVARRFGNADLLRSIVLPSDTISDQYQDEEVWTIEEELFLGRIVERTADEITLQLAPPEEGSVRIPLGKVDEIRPHPLSRMPAGLVDVLTEDELLDLFAYLRSGLALLEDEAAEAKGAEKGAEDGR